jgi:hypothetical protein
MNSTENSTENSSIAALYAALRTMVFQDPIMTAIATGKLSWADAYTKEDEARYQDYIIRGEGYDILNQFRDGMKNTTSHHAQWEENVDTRSAPIQLQQVTTTVLFNPNQIKTLIARNLPRDVTSDELRTLFEKHGPIRDAYVPKNLDKNSPYYGTIKGFALIKFMSHTDSTRAFCAEQTQLFLRGKMISIEFAKEDR